MIVVYRVAGVCDCRDPWAAHREGFMFDRMMVGDNPVPPHFVHERVGD